VARMDPELQKQIIALCQHAAQLAEMREYAFALSKYYDALAMVPDPKQEYKAATWIYSSIGQVQWKKRDYNEAGRAFLQAYRCVGGEQSADINYRLGQCLVECGAPDIASQYLCQAYMLDGESIFADDDPKYFEVIKHEVEGPEVTEQPEEDPEDMLDGYEMLSQLAGGSHSYAEPVVVDEGPNDGDDEHDRRYRVKAGQRYRVDRDDDDDAPRTPRTARYDDGWRSPRSKGERDDRRQGRDARRDDERYERRSRIDDHDEREDEREDRPRTGRAGLPVGDDARRAQRSQPMPARFDDDDDDDEYEDDRPNIWGRILDFIDRFR